MIKKSSNVSLNNAEEQPQEVQKQLQNGSNNTDKVEEPQVEQFLKLLRDIQKDMDDIQSRMAPVLKKIEDGDVVTEKGISLLETKLQLLLSYSMNIMFFIQLKCQGKQIQDHPVIFELIKLRTYLEKIKPIEYKLKYQVDKLIKVAVTGQTSQGTSARKHKPNLDNFAQIEELEDDAIYKPPQLIPVSFEGDETKMKKEKRRIAEEKRKFQRSEMAQILKETLGDAPEEIGPEMGEDASRALKKLKYKEEERRKFEENNFVRLQVSSKEKGEQKRLARATHSAYDNIDELRGLDAFLSKQMENGEDDEDVAKQNAFAALLNERKSKRNTEFSGKKRKLGSSGNDKKSSKKQKK